MRPPLLVEFVAGPLCGRTETIDRRHGPTPPLSVATASGGTGDSPVYRRRATQPDPRTGHWMFDHVPRRT